ncbi:MAG: hypothetical protein DCC57_11385 [Chloroflexi bacterium]|nr:MAG: hypothetical protein DCC57_11385 [Chloroflexota bacterium]
MEKQLTPGMAVHCSDGEAGRLEKIVGEPDERTPAYLVVQRGRPIRRRHIVVPVSLVRDVAPDRILLDTTLQALETFPDFEVTVAQRADPADLPAAPLHPLFWPAYRDQAAIIFRARSVPETSREIRRGMPVYDNAGAQVGQVAGLLVDDETRQASHLVLNRKGPRAADPRLVPVDLVDYVVRDDIYLRIGQDQVVGLTVYQTQQPETA